MAFNSASLGYVHAMAHQLGGFYNLPHGVCNAVLLPAVQEYNAKFVPELFIDIAQAMGIADVGEDQQKAVKEVLAAIRSVVVRCLSQLSCRPLVSIPVPAFCSLDERCKAV